MPSTPTSDTSSQNRAVLGSQFLRKVFVMSIVIIVLLNLNFYCCPLSLGFNLSYKRLNRGQALLHLNLYLHPLFLDHDHRQPISDLHLG